MSKTPEQWAHEHHTMRTPQQMIDSGKTPVFLKDLFAEAMQQARSEALDEAAQKLSDNAKKLIENPKRTVADAYRANVLENHACAIRALKNKESKNNV